MRFHQPVGIVRRNNSHVNGNNNNNSTNNINKSDSRFVINGGSNTNRQVTHGGTIYYASENENHSRNNNFTGDECLQTLKSIIHEKENNFDSRDVNRLETLWNFKTNSCGYFKNFIDTENTNINCRNHNIDLNGNNDNVLLIETLNLTENNLSRVSETFFVCVCV